jgi:hypothetical protein
VGVDGEKARRRETYIPPERGPTSDMPISKRSRIQEDVGQLVVKVKEGSRAFTHGSSIA